MTDTILVQHAPARPTPSGTKPPRDASHNAPDPLTARYPTDGFPFAAFISYRHCEPDASWARWLHKSLEGYRVPARLRRERGLPAKVGRVFRDEEELEASSDLRASIASALERSAFLIVVCSPRTPASRWVDLEVQRFRELGRGDRILALLVEGGPDESFPRPLREIRREAVEADGTPGEHVEEVEPLAADVRPAPGRRRGGHAGRPGHWLRPGARDRTVQMRLLAPMLGVRFDDLRQREHERRMNRLALVGAMLAALCVGMGLLAAAAVRSRDAAVVAQAEKEGQRLLADAQRREALRQKAEADAQRDGKEAQRVAAETRTAEALLAQGDALGRAGQWAAAFDLYEDARVRLAALGLSTLPAEYAAWDAYRRTAPPLLTIRTGGGTPRAVFTPDGARVLAGGPGRVDLRGAASGRVERSYQPKGGHVTAFAASADGRVALAGVSDRTVRAWDVATGREVCAPLRDDANVRRLGASPAGDVAVTLNDRGTVRVWDVATGASETLATKVADMALSADGRFALVAFDGDRVAVWDVAARRSSAPPPAGRAGDAIYACAISADGAMVAAGDYSGRVTVWDVATGLRVGLLDGHRRSLSAVAFSPDRRFLATGGDDATVRLWDLADMTEVRTMYGHAGPVVSLDYSRDGRYLVGAGADGTLKVWATGPAPAGRTAYGHDEAVGAIALSPDGRMAFSADGARARLWDVATGRMLWTGLVNAGGGAAFTPDGGTIVTAGAGREGSCCTLLDLSADGPIARRDVRTGKAGWGMSVAVAPDGRTALVGCADKSILRIDIAAGALVGTLPPAPTGVSSLSFSPDGAMLALTAGPSAEVRDAAGAGPARELARDGSGYDTRVTFMPDGRQVFGGGSGAHLVFWDPATGRKARRIPAEAGGLEAVAVAPDGRVVATAHATRAVRVWDADRGVTLRTLFPAGGTGAYAGLAWAARAPVLASTGGDAWGVRLIDVGHLDRFRDLRRRAAAAEAGAAAPGQGTSAIAADLITLGAWYAHMGAWDRALACLQRARKDGADVPPDRLAQCLRETERSDLAVPEYEAALARLAAGGASGTTRPSATTGPAATMPATRATGPATTRSAAPVGGDGSADAALDVYLRRCLDAARRESRAAAGGVPLARALAGHAAPVFAVDVANDGRSVLTGAMDGTAKWWDPAAGVAARTFHAHAGIVRGVALVPRQAGAPTTRAATTQAATAGAAPAAAVPLAVTAGSEGTIKLWRLDTAQPLFAVPTGENLRCVAVAPDGRTAAAGGAGGKLWFCDLGPPADLTAVRAARPVNAHKSWIATVRYSPDGSRLATGSGDSTVVLWDSASGRAVRTLRGHGDMIRGVTFSPDGGTLATAGKDRTVRLWDVTPAGDGKPPRVLTGHGAGVYSAAFANGGRAIVSADEAGTVIAWDAATGAELGRTETGSEIRGVAAGRDRASVFTGGYDQLLREWTVPGRGAAAKSR